VASQGVRLSPFGGNFYPSTLSSGTNSNVKELLFIIPLCKKDKAFCLCLFDN